MLETIFVFVLVMACFVVLLVALVTALLIYVCNYVLEKITGYGIPDILELPNKMIKNKLKAFGIGRKEIKK